MKRLSFISPYFLSIIVVLLIASCNTQEVPLIKITKDDKINWHHKTPCKILYSTENDSIDFLGRIKFRGGSSSKYFKHSFSIELDEKFSMADLPIDDDWILNANYIDKTFMRHKISYDLFRQMDPANIAAKCAYVNIELNKKYLGLYVLMEKINAGILGIDKTDSMAMIFKDPPIFRKERLQYVANPNNYYEQKYPKIKQQNNTQYLEKFRAFLLNSSDTEFAQNISNWIDLNNIIDWHILLLFSNNQDGLLKNFYLYKINNETPFKIAIWDYDHSFGRDGDNERNMMERPINWQRAVLLQRLMVNKQLNYPEIISQRYFELRKKKIISKENFRGLVRKNNKIIKTHLKKNFERWPIDGKWYYDSNNYEQEIELMLNFVDMRIPQLDTYFKEII